MNEINYDIDTRAGLISFCKLIDNPLTMDVQGAAIILRNLNEHGVLLHTDEDGKLYQKNGESEEFITTMDDVVDQVCEWNYEDIEAAKRNCKPRGDYVALCKAVSIRDRLEEEKDILDGIFYQTRYGKSVCDMAGRVAAELMNHYHLVPVYDFLDDGSRFDSVSEEGRYLSAGPSDDVHGHVSDHEVPEKDEGSLGADDISENRIVLSEPSGMENEHTEDTYEPERTTEQKGAR